MQRTRHLGKAAFRRLLVGARSGVLLTGFVLTGAQGCRGDRPCAEATPGADAAKERRRGAADTPAHAGSAAPEAHESKSALLPEPWLLSAESGRRGGARITGMDIRSFAAPLVEPGDVILAVDGRVIRSAGGLASALRGAAPGSTVLLTLRRNEHTIDYAMLQVPDAAPGSDTVRSGSGRGG